MKELARFFALQYVVCATATWNFRAIARANIAHTIASDVAYSVVNFLVVKRIADSNRSRGAMAGYMLGNILGSVTTIVLTRLVWGS